MSGGGTLDSVLVSTTRSGCCLPILAVGMCRGTRSGAWPGRDQEHRRSAWGQDGHGAHEVEEGPSA